MLKVGLEDRKTPTLLSNQVNVEKITTLEGEIYQAKRVLDSPGHDEVKFIAPVEEIEPSKTGIHGLMDIYVNDQLVSTDNFNLEKNAQRKTFAGDTSREEPFVRVQSFYDRPALTTDLMNYVKQLKNLMKKEGVIVEDMHGDPFVEVKQLVHGLVVTGGGTIINALPKQAKSFIAMLLAVSVDSGVDQVFEIEQGKVLFINFERSRNSMIRRLGGINTALGLDPYRPLSFMNVQSKRLSSILPSIQYKINQMDAKLIIVDSISRAGMGNLTDDDTANKITESLNSLVAGTDRAWLGIAHRAWSNEHVYGSVHFQAAADVVAGITKTHNQNTREMGVSISVDAENDMSPQEDKVIAFSFDDMGVKGVRRASKQEFPELLDGEYESKDRIFQYLETTGAQTPAEIARGTGIPRTSIVSALTRNEKMFKKSGNFWARIIGGKEE